MPFSDMNCNRGDRRHALTCSLSHPHVQFGLTFSAVFGVIVYRITVSALMAMSPDPETKSNVRVTVTATAVIINLVVILILDEIYGSVALWLTELGMRTQQQSKRSIRGNNMVTRNRVRAMFSGRTGPAFAIHASFKPIEVETI